MIFCETPARHSNDLNDLAVFVRQLRAAGVEACIPNDIVNLWDDLGYYHVYDIAPCISTKAPEDGDVLLVVNASKVRDEMIARWKRRYGEKEISCIAYGRFGNRQNEIGVRAKFSYSVGVEPEIIDSSLLQTVFFDGEVPILGQHLRTQSASKNKKLHIVLFGPDLDEHVEREALAALSRSINYQLSVVTNAKSKEKWLNEHGNILAIYHYGELLPQHLSRDVDALAIYPASKLNYRTKVIVANVMQGGAAILDASKKHIHAEKSDFFIKTSNSIGLLKDHLDESIRPSLELISENVKATKAAATCATEKVLTTLFSREVLASNKHRKSIRKIPGSQNKRQQTILYTPTNGVGLGHAQRCSLVAKNHSEKNYKVHFAAFPSCVPMLNRYGFSTTPLISRSNSHKSPIASDLVNYSRLFALGKDTDKFVFDGGYIYDSVYRAILDHGMPSVWIRRGMWQESQIHPIALDREKYFDQIIVPEEAFEELNVGLTTGSKVEHVGPIVQSTKLQTRDKKQVRDALKNRFGLNFDKLVVSMLGGGVAANRSGQLQAISSTMARHSDTLHIVVVWPTATVEPVAFDWHNTRVVKTHHASAIIAASDFFVSAVGYNSFHEAIYNQYPTIFMPQMNSFMDDQTKRAEAAASRNLASVVDPDNFTEIEQEVTDFLLRDKGKEILNNLKTIELPAVGNLTAAEIIEGVGS